MRHLFQHAPRLLGGLAIAALAAGSGAARLASASEIAIDEITITSAGSHDGRATAIPWSGVWWPFADIELSKGWNGTAADFAYDSTAKRWNRTNASKPVNDRSPLLKYDEYVRLATGTDPQTALLECTGDDSADFEHSVYGAKKEQYDKDGVSYSWWGHCNGWCGAALMEKEPVAPIEARGIRFEVGDLKGLLAESFWGVESDFTGRRYNAPKASIRDSRDPGKQLLAALNSGSPKPVSEYIAWYEKAWETTMSASARAAAKPEDFRDELELFDRWYKENYEDAYKDLAPNVFHRILETVIGRKKLAFVADITANEEVWNHPAFAYTTGFTLKRSFTESGAARKEWDVTTTVWYATDGVSESILGIEDFSKTYTYTLVTNESSKVIRGEWTGSSVDSHPDFAWLPTYNPTGADYGENFKLLYGKVLEILPVAHKQSDARAIDLGANGTRASSRRGNDKTTTWSQPVAASGDVAASVAVASGRSVARVAYFQEPVSSSYSNVTASRAALVSLGESTTAPSFDATVRFSSNGKKMVVAYAYDASGRLLGIDEITLDYTTSGGTGGGGTGGGGTGGADDAFEENDSKAAAAAVSAGSYANLACNDDDWYKVTLASTGSVAFRIDFQHSEGDLDIVLEGPSGQIAKSDSTNNVETVSGANLAAGTYYLHVYGYSGARAKYALTATVTGGTTGGGGTTANDDSFEPNNSRSAASALTAGSYPGLKCNDDDWYKVTLAASGSITGKIDFRHAEGDLDLVLEDANGVQLAISESTADSEQVSKASLAAGTYYLHVYGYSGARAAYSLTLTTTTSPSGGGGTTTRTGTVTAASLNVRSGPGTTYTRVTTLSSGTVVTILQESGMWYRVTWNGAPQSQNLWVYKTYVRVN